MPPAVDAKNENSGEQMVVKRPSFGAILLGLIPFVGVCFLVPLWDRIDPRVLGLPFNLFWLVMWIVVSPLCMWGAYRLEAPRARQSDQGGAP